GHGWSGRGSWSSIYRASVPYSDPGGFFGVGGMRDPHRSAVYHLHIAVVGLADGGHDPVPNPGFAPAQEAVVAGRGRTDLLRQSRHGTPVRSTQKIPSSTRSTPRGLFGSNGAITPHSKSLSSYPCMTKLPQLGSLDHISIPGPIWFQMTGLK